MKIAIASDHAGFELKELIKKDMPELDIIDLGTFSADSVDYPDFGIALAEAVAKGEADRGIVICGSGIGMSIAANKVKGIRAALCQTKEFAELSRRHNDANVLVLSGRFISHFLAKEMIEVWLNTPFEGGRHKRRIDKIAKYELKR